MPMKQNPNDLRRNSDIIDEQPTVNRFMDQQEIEWQKRPNSTPEKPNDNKQKKPNEKDKNKEEKKPKDDGEDESRYFCCT